MPKFSSNTWENFRLLWQKTINLFKPEHTSHIYRPRDGFTKTSNPRKPVPYCCRNFHTKKSAFLVLSRFHEYSINCALKREYFLSLFGEEKFGNPRARVLPNFPYGEVKYLTSNYSNINHSFILLLYLYQPLSA